MKKTSKLTMLLMVSASMMAFAACSNSSDTSDASGNSGASNGGENSKLTFTGTPYTVLDDNEGGSMGPDKTYVYFGDWPQSEIEEGVTVDETKSVEQGEFIYYKGDDDAWYAKYSNHYYKVEPIKWCVLDTNKKLLLADKIIINCPYYTYCEVNRIINSKTIYPNNYEYSRIRAYLNGLSYQKQISDEAEMETDSSYFDKGFLQTAFTNTLQTAIATTTVVNDARSTFPDKATFDDETFNNGNNMYSSETSTSDKLFLLSEQEVTNSDYGFSAYNVNGVERKRKVTAFAKENGTSVTDDEGNGYWCLRSPYYKYCDAVWRVYSDGSADTSTQTYGKQPGVVPALCLK